MQLQQFTATQVATHKSRRDLWVIIHGKVYNISKFVSEHPGGEDILLEHAGIPSKVSLLTHSFCQGTDATEIFEDIGHSTDARELMKQFLIGIVVNDDDDDDGDQGESKTRTDSVLHNGLEPPIKGSYVHSDAITN